MQLLLVWTKLYRTFALLKFRGVFLCFVLCFIAGVAQWPEQLICNQLAGGSNPSTGSPIKYPVHFHVTDVLGVRRSWRAGADCNSVVLD